MQDFFKYDKLQQGASLFMKSDHDGAKDAQNRGLPLGIKSTAQGIEHFTNWDNISNSLQERDGARFDDMQPMSLDFGMLNGKNFTDTWEANDITILDDLAFVSYENYTDIQRNDISLSDASLTQTVQLTANETYDSTEYREQRLGTMRFQTYLLPDPDKRWQTQGSSAYEVAYDLDLDLSAYQNTILKIQFNGKIKGETPTSGSDTLDVPDTLYFIYGGAIAGNHPDGSNHPYSTAIGYPDVGASATRPVFVTSNDSKTANWYFDKTSFTESNRGLNLEATNDKVAGYFYLVKGVDSGTVGIQLDLSCTYGYPGVDALSSETGLTKWNTDGDVGLYDLSIGTKSITLIKIQPVRKCGKVDIYTRKKGIITAAVNNRLTSPGHNLNTNDIIDISSALFDGNQNSYADIHPLNGKKFVKKIDDDTFDVYDDQFLEDGADTLHLKTTDGVNWICVSNDFGSLGQSWDYYGTMTSPTGRNGYLGRLSGDLESVEDVLSEAASFITTKRPQKIDPAGDQDLTDPLNTDKPLTGTIGLRFDGLDDSDEPIYTYVNSYFAKNIDDNIPVTFSSCHNPLRDPKRSPDDFYPYRCKSQPNESDDDATEYWGTRFGCSLDFKFSHMSGDSKVYVLAVGERGSDVSVDLFGCVDGDNCEVVSGGAGTPAGIYGQSVRRVEPYYLPHGKTHVLSVTVDKYNRITDVSHQNTLFGGGGAIKNTDSTDYIEENPWTSLQESDLRPDYNQMAQFNIVDPVKHTKDSLFYEPEYFTDLNDKYTTKYWLRSAVMHWFPQNIADYVAEGDSSRSPYYEYAASNFQRTFEYGNVHPTSSFRGSVLTQSSNGVNQSRFGKTQPGTTSTRYKRIDRFGGGVFGNEGGSGNSWWFIFPWVDSFGKSVAIQTNKALSTSDAATMRSVVLSGSRTRSNIEITAATEQPALVGGNLTTSETQSQIGQITAHFISNYSGSYDSIYFSEFNKGGTTSRSSSALLTANGVKHRVLPDGYLAGDGVPEVVSSAELSASHIIYKDGLILWTDQLLADSMSVVNVFKFEGDEFKSIGTFSKSFSNNKAKWEADTSWGANWAFYLNKNNATYAGDGFGWGLRYDDDLLVTNAMDTTNEMGDDIGVLLGGAVGTKRVDFLQVYERDQNNEFKFDQKISATFDKTDTDTYPEILVHQFKDYLLSFDAVNYRNDSIGSTTWDIKLLGRYDTADKKIILKDPLEYSLFGRDYSAAGVDYDPTVSNTYTQEITPYLYFREKYTSDNDSGYIYYDYTQRTDNIFNLLDESTVRPSNYGGITGGTKSYSSNTYSQVFFLDVPTVAIDNIQDITVTFKVNSQNSYFKTIDCETGEILGTTTQDTLLVPKVVLYRKDPRSMIIPNGPASTGTYNNFPKYVNGTWTSTDAASTGEATKFPPHFRGGANDLHFYGSLPGSAPSINDSTVAAYKQHYYGGSQTLGELYDATFDQAGNTNRGIPSWAGPDTTYYLNDDEISSMVPYAYLSGFAALDPLTDNSYSVTIPKSVVRDNIIRGSLIKSSDNNRSLFATFDRLYHGVPSSWTRSYDDINQPSYDNTSGINGNTLAIGFILTSVSAVDINTKSLSFSDPGLGIDALRAVEFSPNKSDRAKSKYPYSPTVAIPDTNINNQFAKRKEFVEFELSSSIEDPIFTINKRILPQRKFANKFHKVAIFQYGNSMLNEVQQQYLRSKQTYIGGIGQKSYYLLGEPTTTKKYFGGEPFLPLPIGLSDDKHIQTANPIIRFGKSSASAELTGGNKGTFAQSLQILNTENLTYDDTSYYEKSGSLVHNPSPSGSFLGRSYFEKSTMIGGFDIQSPQYLPLIIKNHIASGHITLNTEGHIYNSGLSPLRVVGVEFQNNNTPLWIGTKEKKLDTTLYLKNQQIENSVSLYTFEVAPSDDISIYLKAPNAEGNLNLTFAPPATGSMPLNILGPLPDSGVTTLLTHGSGAMAGQAELFVSGSVMATGDTTLYVSGLGVSNASIPLSMVPPVTGSMPLYVRAPVMNSGNTTLNTIGRGVNSGVAPLFIGDQFDTSNVNTTLFVKSQSYNSGQTTLLTDGSIDTANSNKNGAGAIEALVRNGLFDQGGTNDSGREAGITKVLGNNTYVSNSINGNTLDYDVYTTNRMNISPDTSDGLWAMGSRIPKTSVYDGDPIGDNSNKKSLDPALATVAVSNDNNATTAFYVNDNQYNNLTAQNTVIRQNAYDANGEYLVKANMRDNIIEIGMYTINGDGSVSQKGTNGTESTLRTNPSLEAESTSDLGHGVIDPFYTLRTDIYNHIKNKYSSSYKTYDIDTDLSEVSINDLKISKHNRCALSCRVKVYYVRGSTSVTTTFDVVLTFNIGGYGGVYSGFENTSDYSWVIFEESGENQFKQDAAYNVEFDNEDIYFDRRSTTWGELWKLSQSDNYVNPSRMIKFSDLSDAQAYTKAANLPYITPDKQKAAFGVPFKIFDEYNVSGGKIMFVGATLFDPYVLNVLTDPYSPNAMGAVYIYRRAAAATSWSYEGAVYSKGYTSANILSNLSQYRSSTLSNNQYSLFGYDFDYYEGNLIVSEPGGNGTYEISAGRAYLFDVTSTPTLINTYLGSSISLPDSATIKAGDNFGSSIVLPAKLDPITYSDATLTQQNVTGFTKYSGDSTIYNLRSKSVFGFTYETVDGVTSYTSANLKNETDPYAPSSVSDSVINRWSRVLSIKRLDFGTTQKLGVIREFVVRRDSPYHNDSEYSFRVQKLSILNLQRSVDGTLFIKGPTNITGSMDVFTSGVGAPTSNIPLVLKDPLNVASGVTTLYVGQVEYNQQPYIPLHINQVTTPNIPLHISGVTNPSNNSTVLSIPQVSPAQLLTLAIPSTIGSSSGNITLNVEGSTGAGVSNRTTLFIGKDILSNSQAPLFLQTITGAYTPGSVLYSSKTDLFVSGTAFAPINSGTPFYINAPLSGNAVLSSPLHIQTVVPPVGAHGGYVGSGVLPTVISGSGWGPHDHKSTLYLRANPPSSGVTTLYINKPFVNTAPLYTSAMNPANIPLFTSGAFISTADASLYTYAPPNTGIALFTYGYRE